MLKEFRDFIDRGNVVDLAVAFIMGLAFKPIVDAIVNRVLMPLIGLAVGKPNFDAVGTFACEAVTEGTDPASGIVVGSQICAGSVGAVITVAVNFLLIAFALFLVVKAYNRTQNPEEPAAPEADPEEVVLLREIRDALAER